MSDQRVLIQHVVAVDPRGEQSRSRVAVPRLIAALWPPSRSLTHCVSQGRYFLMISTEPSVLPPSRTKYSRFGYPWSRIERSVASRNRAWLKDGVTTLMRGQACHQPSSVKAGLPSVHGQPVHDRPLTGLSDRALYSASAPVLSGEPVLLLGLR